MTIATTVSNPPPLPERRLWTRQEYERAAALGLFGPEEKMELIEGEIVQKMAAMHTPHITGIVLTTRAFHAIFTEGYHLRIQAPLAVSDYSEPEPDIAVVVGDEREYETAHPTTAILVVEVADSSLAYDRTTKAALYAQAGVPEYWILNLPERLLEMHRHPIGSGYQSVTRYEDTQSVSPLAAPDAVLLVADLLPRRQTV